MRWLLTLVVAAVGLAAAPPAAAATTHNVLVEDNRFTPRVIQIDPGDTVTWTSVQGQHTVTADDGRFDFHPDRVLSSGERVSRRFDDEEEVRYFCRIHGGRGGQGMSGLVRVGDPPTAPVPDVPVVVVPDDVRTLKDAAKGAQPGTRVLVRPGVYREEDVVVSVPGLEIRGLGDEPADVILDGMHRSDIGVNVAAADVTIANVTVTSYRRAGIALDGASGTVIEDAHLAANGLYGVRAVTPAGLVVRGVHATGHGVAGIGIRQCVTCGARVDDALIEGNAAGIVAVAATGIVMRNTSLRDNAVGVVLRDASGARVTGNTIADNAATDVWVASVFDGSEPPTGAGVWINGGKGNHVISNVVTGHTYNVVVTGAALGHRIVGNTVADPASADLGTDMVGTGVCFSGNRTAGGLAPTSHPPVVQTLYDCGSSTTAGFPYPLVTANMAFQALLAGYP